MNLHLFDYVFISYDEPNADENWDHLIKYIPFAKRVHGIKGYDAAHKKAAEIATTENLVIVDGDCKISPDFPAVFEFNDGVNFKTDIISWASFNSVNELAYGNGGIKCWPKNVLQSINSHEKNNTVDFDYNSYVQIDYPYGGETVINTTPLQAWRVGFREGIKLKLLDGKYVKDEHPDVDNRQRLWNWQHVGSDVKNGMYCIAGARHSVDLMKSDWDYTLINDLDYLNDLFAKTNVLQYIDTTVLSAEKSREFKRSFINPKRSKYSILKDPSAPQYDIVFISYDEPYADDNYQKLVSRFPKAKRIHKVNGIHRAHIEAAKLATTSHFWVVDADSEILPTFNFDFKTTDDDECVRVWRAKNSINNLEYGYGGVKLLPKNKTLNMSVNNIDMTTSISWNYKPINVISNITNFAMDPFTAWRGAFRECVKLTSKCIKNGDSYSDSRLETWCNYAQGPYAKYVLSGANAGREWAIKYKDDINYIKMINNYRLLQAIYDAELSNNPI